MWITSRDCRGARRPGSQLQLLMGYQGPQPDLRVMTKQATVATGAHISVLGHVTVEELRRELDEVSAANGLGNRVLWLAVTRARALPRPPRFTDDIARPLAGRVRAAIEHAATVDVIDFDYPHWHRLSDTPENCSPDGLIQVSKVISVWLQRMK